MPFPSSARTSSSTDTGYWSCEGGCANDREGRDDATQDGQLSGLSIPVYGPVDSRLPRMPPAARTHPLSPPLRVLPRVLATWNRTYVAGLCQLSSFSRSPFELDSPKSLVYYHKSVEERRPMCVQHKGEATAMSWREPVLSTYSENESELSPKAESRSLETLETLACGQGSIAFGFPGIRTRFGRAVLRF